MEFILSAIALLLLLLAGSGCLLLLAEAQKKIDALEFVALAFLFGCAAISLGSFLLGWLMAGILLRGAVTLVSLAIFAAGFWRARRAQISIDGWLPRTLSNYFLLAIILAPTAFLLWFSAHTGIGWDGLFHWEVKARLAFDNGGVLPLSYLTETALWSSHRGYPLLLPLSQAWFYGWMGVAHQGIIKLFFPLFLPAALCLLATAEGRRNVLAPLPLIFVPLVMFGEGSLSSGYADFLLATYFLGAVISLLRYARNADAHSLRIFAALSLCLPWTKQEGNFLLPILLALLALAIWRQTASRNEKWRRFIFTALPGLLVLLGWALFVRIFKTPFEQYYVAPSLLALRNNFSRTSFIFNSFRAEIFDWYHWGILWLVLPFAIALQFLSRRGFDGLLLTLSVLLPLLSFIGIYYFVATDQLSLDVWIAKSLARLILQVVPVAILLIITAKPRKKEEKIIRNAAPIMP